MKKDPKIHIQRPFKCHEILRDFRLIDFWELPVALGGERFSDALQFILAVEPCEQSKMSKGVFELRIF